MKKVNTSNGAHPARLRAASAGLGATPAGLEATPLGLEATPAGFEATPVGLGAAPTGLGASETTVDVIALSLSYSVHVHCTEPAAESTVVTVLCYKRIDLNMY